MKTNDPQKETAHLVESLGPPSTGQLTEWVSLLEEVCSCFSEIVLLADAEGHILFACANAEAAFGRSPSEIVDHETISSLFGPEIAERAVKSSGTIVRNLEWEAPGAGDGSRRLLLDANAVAASPGLTLFWCRDITDRSLALNELNARESLYRRAISAAGAVPYQLDYQTQTYSFVGDGIYELTGYTPEEFSKEILHEMILDYEMFGRFVGASREEGVRMMESTAGATWRVDLKLRTRSGDVKWLADASINIPGDNGRPIGSVGILQDVTDRKLLSDRAAEARTMEALGRLAGGVAHDFNNLLTAIIGYSDLIAHEYGRFESLSFSISEVSQAAERAAELTRQLLAYGQRQLLSLETVDLNHVIVAMRDRLQSLVGDDVELDLRLGKGLDLICADEAQLSEAIVCLAENARDDISGGGTVIIATGNTYLDDGYRQLHPEVVPGWYVQLLFSDTGEGMDNGTARRMFDPFFSTKELGHGLGLGLATVYGIVKQMQGHIWIYSEPGSGTTFKLLFPRNQRTGTAVAQDTGTPRRSGLRDATIMVVDDEVSILRLISAALRSEGMTVIEAASGNEAITTLSRLGYPPLDLLVTDIIMPGMAGQNLAQHLADHYTDLPVLYISGHMQGCASVQGIESRSSEFLQKPFSPATVTAKVGSMLRTADERNRDAGGTGGGTRSNGD